MPATKQKVDPRVDKRRVTMTNVIVSREDDPDRPGETRIKTTTVTAVDFVRPDVLDAYVADARRRWADVHVSDEPDAGPAGYDGATSVPFGTVHNVLGPDGQVEREEWHPFPHELAGSYFPASGCKNCKHAPQHPVTGEKARVIRAGAEA